MDMIQEKDTAVEKLKDLLAHWEGKCEDYVSTTFTNILKFSFLTS